MIILPAFTGGCLVTFLVLLYIGSYVLRNLSLMERVLSDTPWNLPSRVYAQPFEIAVGAPIDESQLKDRLVSQGYYPTVSVQVSGEYSRDEQGWDFFLRDAETPDGKRPGFPVRCEIREGVVAGLWNRDTGQHLARVTLEPEVLGSIYDPSYEDRRPIPLDDVPPRFIQCLLASEDKSYFEHRGVDPAGILRAFYVNLKRGHYAQGGSTITQQLVRNMFLTRNKTLRRKVDEALMAVLLEMTRSKEQILQLYINECYFGQAGSVSIAGLRQAARYYFGTEPRDLNLSQCALLVALLRGPNYYNPFKYPERVKQRRDQILSRMTEEGTITPEERDQAVAEPLPSAPRSLAGSAPFVVDAVQRRLADMLLPEELQTEGYSIYTTIDMRLQNAAQEAVQEGLEELEKEKPDLKVKDQLLQAALVSIDPYSGAVLALVGGRDFQVSSFNRALLGKRPIGSVIKPFIYLKAMQGAKEGLYDLSPNSYLDDSPVAIQTPFGAWTPQNFNKHFLGPVTLRRALEESLNVPTVRLSQMIGIDVLADFLEGLGFPPLMRVPSLALGTIDLTPLEVAGLYTLFVNQGIRSTPHFIRTVRSGSNSRLPLEAPDSVPLVSPEAAYQVLSMMQGVFERGTANVAYRMGWKGIAAGKTGTSDDRQDSWFVGAVPDLITVVWVGFDRPQPTGLTGSSGALPIWVKFMTKIYPQGNSEPFPAPKGLEERKVDRLTGNGIQETTDGVIQEVIQDYFLPEDSLPRFPNLEPNRIPIPLSQIDKATSAPEPASASENFTAPALPRIDIPVSTLPD
ncbi:MAG TPA: PBP1A family penicillin-binding protein [bacterium]|nr:PBP1A family penicillin-binding protein [bacterium]